jgi:hypothetical protein
MSRPVNPPVVMHEHHHFHNPGFVNPYLYYPYNYAAGYLNGAYSALYYLSANSYYPNPYMSPIVVSSSPERHYDNPPANPAPAVDPSIVEGRRRQAEQARLDRMLTEPSEADVVSGAALNLILNDLRNLAAGKPVENLPGTKLSLSDDDLDHINVTQGSGNIGLLKSGTIVWPAALRGPAFQGPRERLNVHLADAVRKAKADGAVDAGAVKDMLDDVTQLRDELRRQTPEMSFEQHKDAKVFLRNLDDALIALKQPDAGAQLTGKLTLRAKSVPELVQLMSDKGLQFAPALPGFEGAYVALQQALANCDKSARELIAKQ